ncbi:MAG: RagB/SusD family nutrient uptake outer membrane protein [Bacteroidales bacterium]|nr:RagB/SusD family nutrient uptake outer membrane protein [Bacteroidales bacterium]
MKKSIILAALAVVGISLASCDDFLDDNRYPLTLETDSPAYWNNPDNVSLEVNQMYAYFTGYATGSTHGEFYFNTRTDDQCPSSFQDWSFTSVPTSSTSYTNPYTNIRHSVMIINRVQQSSLEPSVKANFLGIARLCRAFQEYYLVRRYGDCHFIEEPVDPANEELLFDSPREKRDVVFDKILEDLNFACENISVQKAAQSWSKDLAYAMKSYMCLCEGTYRKYCTLAENGLAPDPERAKMLLQESAKASDYLINSGRYSLSEKYRANYQSFYTDASEVPAMINNPEMILFRAYASNVTMNCVQDYTCGSTTIDGLTKDAFDAYLFKDGKPKALTSLNTSDEAILSSDGTVLSIAAALAVRDNRLAQTTDSAIYFNGSQDGKQFTWKRAGAMQMTSSTGYGVSKYDNTALLVDDRITTRNTVCAPIYWYSVILLENAEAKAELGTLTDADMGKTLNLLYKRAELPDQTVASLSSMQDPANNMGVSSLIWEVRRCRRCELIMDYDFRYWDLIRWHQLDKIDTAANPNILLGANAKNSPIAVSNTNGYINGNANYPTLKRTFDKKYYSYPIPSGQIILNNKLGQNFGWEQ